MSRYPLCKAVQKTLILAYQEPTDGLETYLQSEGFSSQVLRQVHPPEYKTYARIYLALLNHRDAWEIAAKQDTPSLIMEADFVPVVGFGRLPLPFDPTKEKVGMGWLYTCASQLYSVTSTGDGIGYSTAAVAYVITPTAARHLLDLERQVTADPGPTQYYNWDSLVEAFLRDRGLESYVPFRNYGEHGGMPNPEHKIAGFNTTHRADVLYDRLAFTPLYAADHPLPQWVIFSTRLQARIKGMGRLLFNKYLRGAVLKRSTVPLRLIRFAIVRHLTLHL